LNKLIHVERLMLMLSARVGTITFDWYPFHARVRGLAEAAVDAG
jgi:hypothetical protein